MMETKAVLFSAMTFSLELRSYLQRKSSCMSGLLLTKMFGSRNKVFMAKQEAEDEIKLLNSFFVVYPLLSFPPHFV